MALSLRVPISLRASGRLGRAAVLCLAALAVSGCQGISGDTTAGAAQIRFVDASPSAPGLDFYLSSTGAAYNVGFATFTSYVPVASGTYALNANRANTSQALVSAHATLMGAHQYTAVVSHSMGDLQENIYPDRDTPAPAGHAAVRILNEAEIGEAVDVYLVPGSGSLATTAPAVTNLAAGAASPYIEIPATGSYTAIVLPAGSALFSTAATALSSVTVKTASGCVRTIVLTENTLPGAHRLYSFVLDDLDVP